MNVLKKKEPKEIIILYTRILTRNVDLSYFFRNEMSEKIHKSSIRVKISVQNVIILHGCMWRNQEIFSACIKMRT